MTTPQAAVGQGQAYPPGTRVRLLRDIDGSKQIGKGQSPPHKLKAGTIASIREGNPVNPRSSSNNHPISANQFLYKLTATIEEDVRDETLEGPYTGVRDDQKIKHSALDTVQCPPKNPDGIYRKNERSRIRTGQQYTFQSRSGSVTLKGGDSIAFVQDGTTKTGGRVLIAKNAWYLSVNKVTYQMVQKKLVWKSDYAVSHGDWFEVVN